jgi:hypothetical protein
MSTEELIDKLLTLIPQKLNVNTEDHTEKIFIGLLVPSNQPRIAPAYGATRSTFGTDEL